MLLCFNNRKQGFVIKVMYDAKYFVLVFDLCLCKSVYFTNNSSFGSYEYYAKRDNSVRNYLEYEKVCNASNATQAVINTKKIKKNLVKEILNLTGKLAITAILCQVKNFSLSI